MLANFDFAFFRVDFPRESSHAQPAAGDRALQRRGRQAAPEAPHVIVGAETQERLKLLFSDSLLLPPRQKIEGEKPCLFAREKPFLAFQKVIGDLETFGDVETFLRNYFAEKGVFAGEEEIHHSLIRVVALHYRGDVVEAQGENFVVGPFTSVVIVPNPTPSQAQAFGLVGEPAVFPFRLPRIQGAAFGRPIFEVDGVGHQRYLVLAVVFRNPNVAGSAQRMRDRESDGAQIDVEISLALFGRENLDIEARGPLADAADELVKLAFPIAISGEEADFIEKQDAVLDLAENEVPEKPRPRIDEDNFAFGVARNMAVGIVENPPRIRRRALKRVPVGEENRTVRDPHPIVVAKETVDLGDGRARLARRGIPPHEFDEAVAVYPAVLTR